MTAFHVTPSFSTLIFTLNNPKRFWKKTIKAGALLKIFKDFLFKEVLLVIISMSNSMMCLLCVGCQDCNRWDISVSQTGHNMVTPSHVKSVTKHYIVPFFSIKLLQSVSSFLFLNTGCTFIRFRGNCLRWVILSDEWIQVVSEMTQVEKWIVN